MGFVVPSAFEAYFSPAEQLNPLQPLAKRLKPNLW